MPVSISNVLLKKGYT